MPKQVVILSGHVGSGKTTLADKLVQQFNAHPFKTFDFLKKRGSDIALERSALQEFGEKLDSRTGGRWVADDLREAIEALPNHENLLVVLDSIRMQGQADSIRQTYGRRVLHVHLDASENVLESRYKNRAPKA